MKGARHAARMGVRRGDIWLVNMRGRDNLEDPGIDGKIVLRWIFRKWDRGHGLDRCGSG
jgi:hypothetical protein